MQWPGISAAVFSAVESSDGFTAPIAVTEYDRPGRQSDDEETAQSIRLMDGLATRDASAPAIREAAASATAGTNPDNPTEQASAVYYWIKRTVRFEDTPGIGPLVDQTLIAPVALLDMPDPHGDCPQFSMLACAMLRNLCIRSRYRTIAADARAPNTYSHVYNVVEIAPDRWMPFDSSNGPAPGAEFARPFKRRTWASLTPPCGDQKGNMIRDRLGDDSDSEEDDYYDTGSTSSPALPVYIATDTSGSLTQQTGGSLTAAQLAALNASGTVTAPASSGSSGSSGANWISTLENDLTSLAAPFAKSAATQKPYYITGANGQQVLYNPNTGTTSTGIAASLSTISPTYLLIGAAALIALIAAGGKK